MNGIICLEASYPSKSKYVCFHLYPEIPKTIEMICELHIIYIINICEKAVGFGHVNSSQPLRTAGRKKTKNKREHYPP